MITTEKMAFIIRVHQHDADVAAIKLYNDITNSLITFNPVSGLPQTTLQVKWERDSLYLSQQALLHKVTKLKLQAKRRNARIKKLEAKLKVTNDKE